MTFTEWADDMFTGSRIEAALGPWSQRYDDGKLRLELGREMRTALRFAVAYVWMTNPLGCGAHTKYYAGQPYFEFISYDFVQLIRVLARFADDDELAREYGSTAVEAAGAIEHFGELLEFDVPDTGSQARRR